MEAVGQAGGMVMVHAENDAGIAYLRRRLIECGTRRAALPSDLSTCRHGGRGDRAGAGPGRSGRVPGLHRAHLDGTRHGRRCRRAAVDRTSSARPVRSTCCSRMLSSTVPASRAPSSSVRHRCAKLKTTRRCGIIWRRPTSKTVGTDHCPFFFIGEKDLGRKDGAYPPFTRIPGGMPGIESRLALLHTFGVGAGRLTLERWVEVCCTGPARAFGLSGRKGALAVRRRCRCGDLRSGSRGHPFAQSRIAGRHSVP